MLATTADTALGNHVSVYELGLVILCRGRDGIGSGVVLAQEVRRLLTFDKCHICFTNRTITKNKLLCGNLLFKQK